MRFIVYNAMKLIFHFKKQPYFGTLTDQKLYETSSEYHI